MDLFCIEFSEAVNKAITSGVSAPQLVMVMEMMKLEIGTSHINAQKSAFAQQQAIQMAEEAAKKKSPIILPPNHRQ